MLVVALVLVAAADQLTKQWALQALGDGRRIPIIGRYLELGLVRNSGGAFGIFPGATQFLFVASSVILIVVAVWAWRTQETPVSLGLVLGGGIGNIIDRLFQPPGPTRGHVVDFIASSFWPTFNVADAAITTGVVLLLVASLRQGRDE